MGAVSKETIEKGIAAVYKELGLKNAVLFFRAISGGRGNFALEHKTMSQFSDKNVKKIFKELIK